MRKLDYKTSTSYDGAKGQHRTVLFPVVHPTARLLHRFLSFHKFPFDAALRRNWVRNICRVESKGVWTNNSSTRMCTKHFTAKLYHVSGRKRMHKTTRTNRILKSNAIPRVFNCSPQRLQPTSSKSTCQCPRWKLVEGSVEKSCC